MALSVTIVRHLRAKYQGCSIFSFISISKTVKSRRRNYKEKQGLKANRLLIKKKTFTFSY